MAASLEMPPAGKLRADPRALTSALCEQTTAAKGPRIKSRRGLQARE